MGVPTNQFFRWSLLLVFYIIYTDYCLPYKRKWHRRIFTKTNLSFSKSYLFYKLHWVAKYVKFIIQMTYLTEGLSNLSYTTVTTFCAFLCGILICFPTGKSFCNQILVSFINDLDYISKLYDKLKLYL